MPQYRIIDHYKQFNWISFNLLTGMKWKNSFPNRRLLIIVFWFFLCTYTQHLTAQENETRILKLDHKHIDSILDIHETHLVFFWGTWCKPCYVSLDTILLFHQEAQEIKMLILAESNSSMKMLEKVFNNYNLRKANNIIFGILDRQNYKKSSKKNIRIFNRFICNQCVQESKVDLRFSAVFIFDAERKLQYYNKRLVSEEYNLIKKVIKSL